MTPGRLKVWNEDANEWEYVNAPAGGSQPAFLITPATAVAFDSPDLGTTGFVVAELLAGDIVCGFGANAPTLFTCVNATAKLFINDSSGIQCINGGSLDLAQPAPDEDADAVTLQEVFDGWTLLKNDAPVVVALEDTSQQPDDVRPVDAVNQGTKTFTVESPNAPLVYDPGTTFQITGSTGNDGTYTIDSIGPQTGDPFVQDVTVLEAIPSATADGDFSHEIPLAGEADVWVAYFRPPA